MESDAAPIASLGARLVVRSIASSLRGRGPERKRTGKEEVWRGRGLERKRTGKEEDWKGSEVWKGRGLNTEEVSGLDGAHLKL